MKTISVQFHAHQCGARHEQDEQDPFVDRPTAAAVRERLTALVDPLGRIHLDKSHPAQSVRDAARAALRWVIEQLAAIAATTDAEFESASRPSDFAVGGPTGFALVALEEHVEPVIRGLCACTGDDPDDYTCTLYPCDHVDSIQAALGQVIRALTGVLDDAAPNGDPAPVLAWALDELRRLSAPPAMTPFPGQILVKLTRGSHVQSVIHALTVHTMAVQALACKAMPVSAPAWEVSKIHTTEGDPRWLISMSIPEQEKKVPA